MTNNYKSFKEITDVIHLTDTESINISVLGWEDGDYFIELCMEDGGIELEIESIYKQLPIIRKINKDKFLRLLEKLTSNPQLSSKNGNVIYNYDIHLWQRKKYYVFNLFVKKFLEKDLNLLQRVFKPLSNPKWIIHQSTLPNNTAKNSS